MNLAKVERLVFEGDLSADALRYLLSCKSECERLDYKESLTLDHDQPLCGFARDVLAIKNIGGGFLVIGVQDKTWIPLGLKVRLPYDGKLIRDQLRHALGLELEVDIVHHEILVEGSSRLFALIYVRASRKHSKRRMPTLSKNDFCSGKPFGIRRGEIYVRKGDTTVKLDSESDLADLLDTLDETEAAASLAAAQPPSPFAVQSGLYRLLEPGFNKFIGRADLKETLIRAVTKDPRLWIINVHGPGGVGKSALVNWATYALYQRGEFESIIQLTAKETILTEKGILPLSRTLYSLENLLDHILSVFEQSAPEDLAKKKALAVEILSVWKTLLVLDNMETVSDGRILEFVQGLPVETKAKVLLTSRQRTGGWELPLSVAEFTRPEVAEFLSLMASELDVQFPTNEKILDRVVAASGGLPLAVKWIVGQFRLHGDLDRVLSQVAGKDSPVLEFSFRNMWNALSLDGRAVLSVLTIFEAPPTSQLIAVATEFPPDLIGRAMSELSAATLTTPVTDRGTGQTTYVTLPITLAFARNQLSSMGDFELVCRRRLQHYTQQMSLQEAEVSRFKSDFERYGISTDTERRAAILCKRAESEAFAGRSEISELSFQQARDLAPASPYVLAMWASFALTKGRIGEALDAINDACKRSNKRTGALCYTIKAQILDTQHDKPGRVMALKKALDFTPDDVVVQHQYGVALSRAGRTVDAVAEFTRIIEGEKTQRIPTPTLLMALTTRIINLRRLGRDGEADSDLSEAKSLIASHPHLGFASRRLKDLDGSGREPPSE